MTKSRIRERKLYSLSPVCGVIMNFCLFTPSLPSETNVHSLYLVLLCITSQLCPEYMVKKMKSPESFFQGKKNNIFRCPFCKFLMGQKPSKQPPFSFGVGGHNSYLK